MKYYGVRCGLVPGVYATWEDCQRNVKGVSGAQFKSFNNLEEAEAYVAGDKKPVEEFDGMHIFYKLHGDMCEVPIVKRTFRGSSTIEAELIAVVKTVEELVGQGYSRFRIHYKNPGVENWYNGAWTPKSQVALVYSSEFHALVGKYNLHIEFVKQR